MRPVSALLSLSASCLLSACGGGSAGGVASAPVTVVPAATPTPTPAASVSLAATATASAPSSGVTDGSTVVTAQPAVLPQGSPLAVTPDLLIADTLVAPGERTARVQIRLSTAARRPLAWKCLTVNGSAYAGTHYETTAADLMFRPGETVQTIDVPVKRDLGGLDFKLSCAWPQMYPAIPGATGAIRQGPPVASAALTAPSYPTVQRQSGRTLAFQSTFAERVTPNAVSGAWRSRFDWGRVQTGNGEIAPYTDATTDTGVAPHPIVDGKRVLRAEYARTSDSKTGKSYDFSASLLDSANLFTFQYGYVELRAKLAIKPGTVGAFWLLPASGAWPPEIDIFEFNLGDHRQWTSSVHFTADGKAQGESINAVQYSDDGDWHVIGFDWTRDWQVTYLDGVEVARRPNIFNEPMKVVLDVSVGGLNPDPANPQAGWKSEMTLDYLKVWQ